MPPLREEGFMKVVGAFTALFFSVTVMATDYTITRFEASDYRSFTDEEMSELLGENRHLLPFLKCNGRDEYNPFHAPLRMNPLRNSLKIKIPKSETIFTYQWGKIFDEEGTEVTRVTDPFVKKVVKALLRFEDMISGEKLLRMLEGSYFPLVISLGNNSFNPQIEGGRFWSGIKMAQAIAFLSTLRMSPGGHFSDIGVGGQILWNPDLEIDSIESDNVSRKLDPDVALAHEMYHAFDSIRGMLDMGIVTGQNYEFESIVEYRAVYFENLIRKELGIKYRKHYGKPVGENPADLLDQNGEPLYIPSTCLN